MTKLPTRHLKAGNFLHEEEIHYVIDKAGNFSRN